MKIKGIHIFIAIVCLTVAASIVAGFMLVGSPSQQRAISLDQQRINDLQQISYAVDSYYNQANSQRLPVSLEVLRGTQNVYVNSIVDQSTGTAYEYHVVGGLNYQLCATFETDVNTTGAKGNPEAYPQNPGSTFWDHSIGHKCFDLKVTTIAKPVM
jgi:hypothetical protein